MPHAPTDPSSLWWAQSTPTPRYAPLRGHHRADVAVVGAGIVGATVTADLARAGHDVVLLESGLACSGATGNTTAKLTALQSPRYARLAREHGHETARQYAAFSVAAVERIRSTAPADADFESRTAVTWTASDAAVDVLREELEAAKRAGLPVRPATTDDDDLPIRTGIALDDQGQFDPVPYVRDLLVAAVDAGARVYEHTPVTGVSLRGRTRQVRTTAGAVTAGRVVIATGLPILDRGGWFARAEPHRSYALAVAGGTPPSAMAIRVDGPTRSSRPAVDVDGTPVTVVAGEDHRTGRGGDTRQRYEHLRAWASSTFGAEDVRYRWSAQDWRAADGLPLVGPLVPGDDRVMAACGFDKWGLTSGTAAAERLVRRIRGAPLEPVDRLLDPVRFHPRAAVGDLVRHNAVVGWTLSTGWLRGLAAVLAGDLAEGDGVVHRVGVTPVATSRTDGVVRSCSAVCSHLGGVVVWEPGDRAWACPLHGSRFGPDGRVQSGPATSPLSPHD